MDVKIGVSAVSLQPRQGLVRDFAGAFYGSSFLTPVRIHQQLSVCQPLDDLLPGHGAGSLPDFLVKPVKIYGGDQSIDCQEGNTDALDSMEQTLAQQRKTRTTIHHALGCL